MAYDGDSQKLYIAALGNGSVEIINPLDLKHIDSIRGLKKPCGIAVLPKLHRIAVSAGDDDACVFFDSDSLKEIARVKDLPDADNVRAEPDGSKLYVGYGEGAIAVIDPAKAEKIADVKLDAHPESFQLEPNGKRIFANVPGARHVAVIDREHSSVSMLWRIEQATANFSMAVDEKNKRVFIVCRNPAKVLVLDSDTGKTITTVDCVGDADDAFYDVDRKRVYISGGAGGVSVIAQKDADHYEPIETVKTAPGSRTSFFDPHTSLILLAVPHRGENQRAQIVLLKAPPM
jgi:DNA-binding beta-propeller fold protein YncE